MIEASGLHASLRSREELPIAATDIYVADTMGELGLFYRLSPIVFMGGSLIEHGGQNPIEAIKLGASVVHGPHVFNFADVYEALDGAGGARLAATREALVKQLGQLLADPACAQPRARRCRTCGLAAWAARSTGRSRRSSLIFCSCASKWGRRMHEPAFWYRPSSLMSLLLSPLAAIYGAVAAAVCSARALTPAFPYFASATITSAVPARRRPCSRW